MRVSLEEMLTGLDIHVTQRPMDMAMFGRTNHSLYQQSTFTKHADFVALNFDYYAETYFLEWDSEGNIYTPGDYSAITLDWEKMAINTTDFLSLNGLILMMMVLVESTPMMMESPIVQNP